MIIIKTTDNRHLGLNIDADATAGDILQLNDFTFQVQSRTILETGNVLLASPNYQLECEEQ